MAIDVATFRTNFPEFADMVQFPDASVQFYLNLGYLLLNPARWVDVLDYGVQLFTSHSLVIYRRNVAAAASGGIPGQPPTFVTGKTVGSISVNYTVAQQVYFDNWGAFNLTSYGLDFAFLAQMAGMGGDQLWQGPLYNPVGGVPFL
jgi:hypothetical protein